MLSNFIKQPICINFTKKLVNILEIILENCLINCHFSWQRILAPVHHFFILVLQKKKKKKKKKKQSPKHRFELTIQLKSEMVKQAEKVNTGQNEKCLAGTICKYCVWTEKFELVI